MDIYRARRLPNRTSVTGKLLLALFQPVFFLLSAIRPNPLKRRDIEMEAKIRRHLCFLFEQYGGEVVSNYYFPRCFGNSVITVRVQNIDLRLSTDVRDSELHVEVAPRTQGLWVPFDEALASIGESRFNAVNDSVDGAVPLSFLTGYGSGRALCSSFKDKVLIELAAKLQPCFDHLNKAFSEMNYPLTHERLSK